MRGLVFEGPGTIVYRDDLPEPAVVAPTDAVVAVRRAGLCGSDLHPYQGREPARAGIVAGHEIVGTVVATGAEVTAHEVGDRVLAPFTTSCGRCRRCRDGLTARCPRGQLFGFGAADAPTAPALDGGQAELVRVPLADATLVEVPDTVDDTAAVLLTDNLPTAWCAVERARVAPGAPVIVVGLGAVGLCAVAVAVELGARPVVGIDPVAARRQVAEGLGAVVAAPVDAARAVAAAGAVDGAPAVVEAAGTAPAQGLAAELTRPGGTLSVISVQTASSFGISPVAAYDANLTVVFGRASVRAALDDMPPAVRDVAADLAEVVITDPAVDLVDGPLMYERFAHRDRDLVKAVFAP